MKYPLWKPILILLVLAGCAALMLLKDGNPRTLDLKAGIDLAGGTTLVYDVLVPEGKDAQAVISDTIAIQKERVDPSGVKNLVWRPEIGDRISITMAQAGPNVKAAEEAYEAELEKLLANTLDGADLDAAIGIEDAAERETEFAKLAGGDAELVEQMKQLAVLAAERASLVAPYNEANGAWRDVLAVVEDNPLASEEQKQAEQEAFKKLNESAVALRDARDAYADARADVLANAIDPAEIDRILALSNEIRRGQDASPRQEALESFKASRPNLAAQIDATAAAWAAFEAVKGPLDDPEDLKRLLRGAGVLEFRISAAPAGGGVPAQPLDVSTYAQRLAEKGPRSGLTEDWRWFKVQSLEKFFEERDRREELIANPDLAEPLFAQRGLVARAYGGDFYVLLSNTPGTSMTGDDEWSLTSTSRLSDELGRPAVGFSLDSRGASLMGQLTGGNVGRQMAIVLDGELMSAPTLQAQLSTGGTITGEFSAAEFQYLLNTLGAGSLEGQLSYDPISQKTTGPSLGQDNLNKGLRACLTALIVVGVFMAFYYLFSGLVADFALVANMVIILGLMSMIEATFTLPGIAGLVLTIGMAVDANVLIFERIREELAAKADLPTAVRLGFDKALSTILDANITTLITCIVLGYTATAEVKGFAVVLGVGILATLFTALFSTRVIVDLYLVLTKAKSLSMLPTIVPALAKLLSPNVNWIGLRKLFLPVSVVLIIAGLTVAFYRGEDLLDIEFRSGTEVTFTLAEGATPDDLGTTLPIAEVRERLEAFGTTPAAAEITGRVQEQIDQTVAENAERDDDKQLDLPVLPDWSLLETAQVVTVGEEAPNGDATGFSVATLIENSAAVSDAIKVMFRDELDVTETIDFRGVDLSVDQAKGIVEPVLGGSLYDSLGRQFTERLPEGNTQAFVGGVSILLEDLTPAVSVEDVTERIRRMRRQPAYELLGSRPFQVFGLERAGSDARGDAAFSTLAVVVKDNETNYAEDRSQFSETLGLAATEWSLVKDALQRDTSLASVSNFSSQVSGTMKQQAVVAMVLSLLAVVGYIWLRFGSLRYGLAAIAALVHDVSITMGILAICGYLSVIPGFDALLLDDFKINLALVAALLTIVGYSLNDTIVVFDRIRENRGRLPRATPAIINDSINQTVSRTVLTSGTTLIAVLTLYVLGGPGVHGFAFAMLVGVLVGTYSSVAIAAPILLIGDKSGGAGSDVAVPEKSPAPSGSAAAIPSAAATTS
ncbi:MAG: protein translocase subunit SecD [Planctomycetota bacterium]